jgi:DNA-binding MarR family transcriptional regulator
MSRWLTAEEQQAWRGLLRMTSQLNARMNRQLQEEYGLSLTDYDVLVVLSEAPAGRRRVFEIADTLAWEQSRVSHHLARMQRRGLVAREECRSDARGAFVVLTEAGREAIERAAPAHADTVRRLVFDGLGRDQVAALTAVTSRVLARLAATEAGRLHRVRGPGVGPGAGVDGVEDGQLGLIDGPRREIEGVGGVVLGGLGVFLRLLDVMLVALAVDPVVNGLHPRGRVGLHRLPLALRALGSLFGLLLGRVFAGGDIGPGLAETRLDLLVGFLPRLVEGALQVRGALLQGVDLVGNGHRTSSSVGFVFRPPVHATIRPWQSR